MADELADWRAEIDEIDSEILRLIGNRIELCKEIGKFKHERGLKICNREREEKILTRLKKESKIAPEFIDEIFEAIFREAKKTQERAKE